MPKTGLSHHSTTRYTTVAHRPCAHWSGASFIVLELQWWFQLSDKLSPLLNWKKNKIIILCFVSGIFIFIPITSEELLKILGSCPVKVVAILLWPIISHYLKLYTRGGQYGIPKILWRICGSVTRGCMLLYVLGADTHRLCAVSRVCQSGNTLVSTHIDIPRCTYVSCDTCWERINNSRSILSFLTWFIVR